jgi:hypothetical protein
MTLPKLGIPTYEAELPSNGKIVKYRPFLVKEEKVLLLALESENEEQIKGAVKNLLKNCIVSRIKIDNLAIFDLEYLFLKIRGASIGENIEMSVVCKDDQTSRVTSVININDVKVEMPENYSNKIMFSDTSGVIMKYPGVDTFIDVNFLNFDINDDKVFEVIADSIDQIFDGEDIYDSSTTTKKEFIEFLGNLTRQQFEQIEEFFTNIPKLKCVFKATNPNTGIESEYTIEGLSNFFA